MGHFSAGAAAACRGYGITQVIVAWQVPMLELTV
jgi:hypothetical protein